MNILHLPALETFSRGFACALLDTLPVGDIPDLDTWWGDDDTDLNFFGSLYGAPEGHITVVAYKRNEYNREGELFKYDMPVPNYRGENNDAE